MSTKLSDIKHKGVIFLLVGPAGSGKTTLGEELLKLDPRLKRSVSVTSRAPRSGEKDGVDYYFVSADEFKKKAQHGEFFEWEEIHGNLYGTLRSVLTEAIESGKDLLLIIDIKGALNVKRCLPADSFIVFLVPPSTTVLLERIKGRGAISDEDLASRLETARAEYAYLMRTKQGSAIGIDYLVINEDRTRALAQLRGILDSERTKLCRISEANLEDICNLE